MHPDPDTQQRDACDPTRAPTNAQPPAARGDRDDAREPAREPAAADPHDRLELDAINALADMLPARFRDPHLRPDELARLMNAFAAIQRARAAVARTRPNDRRPANFTADPDHPRAVRERHPSVPSDDSGSSDASRRAQPARHASASAADCAGAHTASAHDSAAGPSHPRSAASHRRRPAPPPDEITTWRGRPSPRRRAGYHPDAPYGRRPDGSPYTREDFERALYTALRINYGLDDDPSDAPDDGQRGHGSRSGERGSRRAASLPTHEPRPGRPNDSGPRHSRTDTIPDNVHPGQLIPQG